MVTLAAALALRGDFHQTFEAMSTPYLEGKLSSVLISYWYVMILLQAYRTLSSRCTDTFAAFVPVADVVVLTTIECPRGLAQWLVMP